MQQVGLIRALGVVCLESGTPEEKELLQSWLLELLHDPVEKVRRYAMTALPKIGPGTQAETALLSLLEKTTETREKASLSKTLDKIGGLATLAHLQTKDLFSTQTEQKVKASIIRNESPHSVTMTQQLEDISELTLHFRCRRGLENFLADELKSNPITKNKLQISLIKPALVIATPTQPFSLSDLYSLRCFKTVGFVLGSVTYKNSEVNPTTLAELISSKLSQRLFSSFNQGVGRYRLELLSMGAQRSKIRIAVNEAYRLCPDILNDSRQSSWSIDVFSQKQGGSVELRPRLSPDPRFYYRVQDIPAASHPPLAASMVRLAGLASNEVVWDPFCGSGIELIERALQGGVSHLYGTDLSPEAITISQLNLAAAKIPPISSTFECCDFRDFAHTQNFQNQPVSLILTNPPMGRRIPIPNLQQLIQDLFIVSINVLKPGGRLVFVNPLKIEPNHRSLVREYRQSIDLGGFDAHLELYRKR